ncbi:MAG: ATP-binding protein [Burkholderiaceae bacterium]|jgi:hypothetical protein|nr:ATP-binding protein [Burkholderiaceae bacterium]
MSKPDYSAYPTETEHYRGIAFTITTAMAKDAKERFADATWVQGIPAYLLLRDDDEITIYFNQLNEDQRDWLHQCLVDGGQTSAAGTVSGLREAERDPTNSSIPGLKVLSQVLGQYIRNDAINGWIYTLGNTNEQMPWLVNDIYYQEGGNAPPNVVMELVANSPLTAQSDVSRPNNRFVYFFANDIRRKKVADVLAAKGLVKETPVLRKNYERAIDRFTSYLQKENQQFIATGEGFEVDFESNRHGMERIKLEAPVKVINDEGGLHRVFFTQADSPFWGITGKPYAEVPIHPRIFCYNMETHTNMWIHVNELTEYQYNPGLREKLILPPEHRDLIDILTQDMDVLMEDIVAGKSGGTTILCKGAPGLGKTLTAEVYAEVVGRPLYRVHSGQLGVSSDTVDKRLDKILKRAQRWGAVMLIDEADVYIRKRANDIEHNAVVASFLRTLEYFHGLLFLTTNRVDDVDDAIASRCVATIVYKAPSLEDSQRIWRVLSSQFDFRLSDKLIRDLSQHFREVPGRDIKELLKLAAKWCRQKQVKPSMEVFRVCSQFRGL